MVIGWFTSLSIGRRWEAENLPQTNLAVWKFRLCLFFSQSLLCISHVDSNKQPFVNSGREKSVSFRNVHKLVHSNGCLEVKKIVKAPTSPNYNCKREVRFLVFFLYSSASTWRSGYFLLPGSNQPTAVKASSAAVGVHGI